MRSPFALDLLRAAGLLVAVSTMYAQAALAQCHDFLQVLREGQDGVAGLVNPADVAASADGRHVYVASFLGDSLAVFERDPVTDALDWIDVLFDGAGGVDGLDGANGLALSADGRHLYVASEVDRGVAVFSRDAATGLLEFVEAQKSPAVGIDHLDGAAAVAVTADGRHVYVASQADNAVAVFARDATTGALTFAGGPRDGFGGVDGIAAAIGITVSGDGRNVYVAGAGDDAVAVFDRDFATGALAFVEVQQDGVGPVEGLASAAAVSLDRDGSRLYAAGFADDAIAVFDRDAATGALTFLASYEDGVGGVTGLGGVNDVLASPDGLWVHAVAATADSLAVFARNALGTALGFRQSLVDGADGVDGLAGALRLAVAPEGDRVYVAGGMDDALAVFAVPPLRYAGKEVDGQNGVDGLSDVNAAAVSTDGRHVYAAGALDDAIAVFARDAASGTLAFVEAEKDGQNGVDGLNGAEGVVVSPDGKSVYASARWDDAVAAFARDPASGSLSFVEAESDGLGGVATLDAASAVTISPEGRHVYVTAFGDDAVTVFARDAATSALTLLESERDLVDGVVGLDGAQAVAVSPDGRNVYVASQVSGAIAVFARDVQTGLLGFVEARIDGAGGVDGLSGAHSVAVSPDGRQVWAAGIHDDALALFSRDLDTGSLTFVDTWRDGVGGVDGLDGASFVAVDRQGRRVYGVGSLENSIAVLERDPGTGEARFRDVLRAECGASGLGGAIRLAASNDGRHLYVASSSAATLAIFAPEGGAASLAAAAVLTLGLRSRRAARRRRP